MRMQVTGPFLAVLAGTILGCAEQKPIVDRPARPIVATVVLKVPGMT